MFSPQTSGWNIDKDDEGKKRFSVNWFEGELAPQTLEEVWQKEKNNWIRYYRRENDDEEGDDHEDEEESEQESDEDESSASEKEND